MGGQNLSFMRGIALIKFAKLCKSLGTKYTGEKLQVFALKCKAAAIDVSNSQVKYLTVTLKWLLVPCNILV